MRQKGNFTVEYNAFMLLFILLIRKQIFIDNLNLINEHNNKYNNGTATYYMDVNSFSDMVNF